MFLSNIRLCARPPLTLILMAMVTHGGEIWVCLPACLNAQIDRLSHRFGIIGWSPGRPAAGLKIPVTAYDRCVSRPGNHAHLIGWPANERRAEGRRDPGQGLRTASRASPSAEAAHPSPALWR